jgi:hypothetical protein
MQKNQTNEVCKKRDVKKRDTKLITRSSIRNK